MAAHSKASGNGKGELTQKGRWMCVAHFKVLQSYNKVANILDVHVNTVKKWVLHEAQHGDVQELRTAIWKVWNGLTPAQLDPFFRNMPDRMQAVIDLGGKRTKY